MRLKQIPFDSLTLAASLGEIRAELQGAKLQRVLSLDSSTVALALYRDRMEKWILLSWHADFARVHLLNERPKKNLPASDFAKLLRSNLDGARLEFVEQAGFDRIARFGFQTVESKFAIIAETMGKHSNLMLLGSDRRIIACAKSVGPSKSSRPITIGRTYSAPPVTRTSTIFNAQDWDSAKASEGGSPFLLALLASISPNWIEARAELEARKELIGSAFLSPGFGAYPIDPSPLGYEAEPIESIGAALSRSFGESALLRELDSMKTSLRAQLERVFLARSAAAHDLDQALETAHRASEFQQKGELILANLHLLEEGDSTLVTLNYDGNPIKVRLDPELDAKANALSYFKKAKRAKVQAPVWLESRNRFRAEASELETAIASLDAALDSDAVEKVRVLADKRRWLHVQRSVEVADGKRVDPFEGHRIRTLSAPGGWTVLYGENATSNDFLTMRIAKPNDWWLHVRGSTSAHVIVQSGNQPQRVGIETLRFAAEVAVRNSTSKHSGYVPVDYTLKKYVRKPKGAHPGTAFYTHEKTLHIEGK